MRSLEALTLLRPASASAAATSSTHASTQRSGTSDGARARPSGAPPLRLASRPRCRAAASSRRRSRRRPRQSSSARVRNRSASRGRSRPPRRGGRRAGRTWADPRTVPRPSPRGSPRARPPTADALPPPGTGADDPSSVDEPVERQVPEASGGSVVHAPIVRARASANRWRRRAPVRGDRRVRGTRSSEPGRARYRRARPEARRCAGGAGRARRRGRRRERTPVLRPPMLWSVRRPGAGPLRRGRSPSSGAIGAGRSATAAPAACRLRRASADR